MKTYLYFVNDVEIGETTEAFGDLWKTEIKDHAYAGEKVTRLVQWVDWTGENKAVWEEFHRSCFY